MNRRDHAIRIQHLTNTPEALRKRLRTQRGVDVPAHLADDWKLLKKKRLTNAEAAFALRLEYKPRVK